jgi:type I restriction enzyme S subunit
LVAVYLSLGQQLGRDYFEKGGKQTTSLASINKTVLKASPLPYRSPAEQIEVVRRLDARLDARLEAADALEAKIDTALARARAVRQSILKKPSPASSSPRPPVMSPPPPCWPA